MSNQPESKILGIISRMEAYGILFFVSAVAAYGGNYGSPPYQPPPPPPYQPPPPPPAYQPIKPYAYNHGNFVPINSFQQNIRGSLENNYNFVAGNGIQQQESTAVKGGPYGPSIVKSGSFSYTSPEGIPIKLNWIADEHGFRPQGSHLPVGPAAYSAGIGNHYAKGNSYAYQHHTYQSQKHNYQYQNDQQYQRKYEPYQPHFDYQTYNPPNYPQNDYSPPPMSPPVNNYYAPPPTTQPPPTTTDVVTTEATTTPAPPPDTTTTAPPQTYFPSYSQSSNTYRQPLYSQEYKLASYDPYNSYHSPSPGISVNYGSTGYGLSPYPTYNYAGGKPHNC